MKRLSGQIITLIQFYISRGAEIVTLDVLETGNDLQFCIGNDCGPVALEDLPVHPEKKDGVHVDYKSDNDLGNSVLLIIDPAYRSLINMDELTDIFVAMMRECGDCLLNIHRKKDLMKYSVSCKELGAVYSELDDHQMNEQLKKHFTALEERLI